MEKLLIGGGRLVTCDPDRPFCEDGAVLCSGGEIAEVGESAALRSAHPDARLVDACGGVIMPGLINAHNHMYSAFARGLSIEGYSPENFIEILKGMWWKLDRAMTLEDVKWSACATLLDCVRNGVTTVFDHHASYGAISGSLLAISEAASALGVRVCLCYEVSDRDGMSKMKEAVRENVEFIRYAARNDAGMQTGMMGLHAPFTLSDATLEYCLENLPSGAGFHTHASEAAEDVGDSLAKYGERPIERLANRSVLGPETIAAHCVHASEREMDMLARSGTAVAHNPESNMGNAVGVGPVPELMRRGASVCLGTDGYTNDMFESWKAGNLIHKHHLRDPNAAWAEIPQMLFQNNATLATRHFGVPLGVIKKGARADVIVADYDPLTPMGAENAHSHLLFGVNGRSVVTTVIDGKVLMQDRRFTRADEGEIMAKCRETARGLWKRVNIRSGAGR
jgi:putative selenium metabolism protein SsnA